MNDEDILYKELLDNAHGLCREKCQEAGCSDYNIENGVCLASGRKCDYCKEENEEEE